MFAKSWQVGDLVWAKMKRFPYWPGKVVDPPNNAATRKSERYIYFFGSKNYGWVMNDYIVPHSETMINNCKKKGPLQAAIKEIVEAALALGTTPKTEIPSVDEDLSIIAASIPKREKEEEEEKESKKKQVKPKKRKFLESTPKASRSLKKIKMSGKFSSSLSPDPTRIAIIRPFDDPPSSSCSLSGMPDPNEIEYVRPTEKKIGFLGLSSTIGRCIVRNLLKSRHYVVVYDANPSKTEDFERVGAIVKSSPALVVEAADIIFSCISDSETAKDVVLRPVSGVLQGLKGTQGPVKGFVEMSSIDEETSKGLAQVIHLKGGKYLEAPITGGRKLADEGLLTILASGDKSLFNECETCFHAIAQHAHFLGSEIGKSIQFSVILNALMGSVTGALVESLALAKRMYVSQKDFLETLKIAEFLPPLLWEKGRAVINQNFSVDTLLRHQHESISTALAMGEEVDQPLLVTSAVNELYKHARSLGYSDHDMAAVYQGARF